MLFSSFCSDPCSVSAASTSSHPLIHAPGSVCTHHTHHVSTRIGIGIGISLRLFRFLHDLVAFVCCRHPCIGIFPTHLRCDDLPTQSHLRHSTSTIFPARSTPPPRSAESPPGQPRPCCPRAQRNPTVRPTHRCHCILMQLGPFWDTSAVAACRPSSCIPAVSLVAIGAAALCCRIPSLSNPPRPLSFTSPLIPFRPRVLHPLPSDPVTTSNRRCFISCPHITYRVTSSVSFPYTYLIHDDPFPFLHFCRRAPTTR